MKKNIGILVLFILVSLSARGQTNQRLKSVDTTNIVTPLFPKEDSIKITLSHITNRIEWNFDSLSKVKASRPLASATDSLQKKGKYIKKEIDNKLIRNTSKFDTLSNIENKENEEIHQLNKTAESLNLNFKISGITATGMNVSNRVGPLRGFSDMKVQIPSVPSLPSVGTEISRVFNITQFQSGLNGDVSKLRGSISTATGVTGEASQATKEVEKYEGEIKNIKQQGLNKTSDPSQAVENEALKNDAINSLKQTQASVTVQTEEYKKLIEQYKQEKGLRQELEEKSKEVANDVIVKYQGTIDTEMKKMPRHFRKFSEMADIRNLPKRAPNPMRGLNWRERVVPGVTFQSLKGEATWVQINPQVYYKLDGNLSAGIGGLYRFSFRSDPLMFRDFGTLYGGIIFVQRYVVKGFFARAEGQYLTWKPWALQATDPKHFDKTTIIGAGFGKSYFIGRKLKGTMQALYHYSWGGADPYKSSVVIRFGFDISIKKKPIPFWQQQLKDLKKSCR